jgi:iron(III) transport system substrate-binding protein
MQTFGGEAAGKAWFKRLKASGMKVFRTNGVTLRALEYGVIDVALVQSTSGTGRMLSGLPFKVIFPKPVTLLPRTIGISSHASAQVRAEAKRFVAFLLSRRGQALALSADIKGGSNFYPLVAGIAPRPGMPSLHGVAVQIADPQVWGRRESEINRWFTDHIVH